MKKTFFIIFLLIIFISYPVFSLYSWIENFPDSEFNYNISSVVTQSFSNELRTYENLSTNTIKNFNYVDFNNRWYGLYTGSGSNAKINYNNSNSSSYNTQYGLALNNMVVYTCSANCNFQFITTFVNGISITPQSLLSFYYKINSTLDKDLYLVFRDINGFPKILLGLDGDADGLPTGLVDSDYTNYYHCDISSLLNINNTLKFFNYTFSNISTYGINGSIVGCPYLKNNIVYDIYSMSFVRYTPINMESFYLDDIRLTYANNSNYLPTINSVQLNSTQFCYNTSKNLQVSSVNVKYDINATDPENDPILYATSLNTMNTFSQVQIYPDKFTLGTCYKKFLFWEIETECNPNIQINPVTINYVAKTDSCPVEFTDPSATPIDYEGITVLEMFDKYNETIWGLYYGHNCTGSKRVESYYKPYDFVKDMYYRTNFHLKYINNSGFNLTFYNDIYPDTVINRLGFEINSSDLVIYAYNTTAKKYLGAFNVASLTQYNYVFMDTFVQYNISTGQGVLVLTDIAGTEHTYNFNKYGTTDGILRYIGVSVADVKYGELLQESFIYGGLVFDTTWSSTPPSNLTVLKPGTYTIGFYVTDSFHENLDQFDYYTTDVTILSCDDPTLIAVNEFQGSDPVIALKTVKDAIKRIADAFDTAYNTTWFYKSLILMWVLFSIIIALVFGFIASNMFPTGIFSLTFIGFSITMAIGSFLFYFPSFWIVMTAVTFALGIGMLVLSISTGNESSGGGAE